MRPQALIALAGFCSLSLAAVVMARMPPHQGRDDSSFTIAVDADLVVFNVSVTDGKGRPVAGLQARDFQVREENQPQNIQLFNAEDAPASIGLIVDNSGSMRDKRADVAKAALAFAHASNSGDEMFVVTFNEKVALGLPPSMRFTNSPEQIQSALVRNPSNGLTALYDAIAMGIEHLENASLQQKALVVLSDGGDNASRHHLDEVLRLAQRSSATIYTIGIYDETDQDRNPRVLRKIAESSGGRAYFPHTTADLERAWRDIAEGIRSQYTIGYHSSNPIHDGRFRTVKITAVHKGSGNLRIATRPGYLVPTDPNTTK